MSARKVTVVCGTGRRFVDVNFDSYEETIAAIRKKWALPGDFILQATVGEKGEQYDIVDDDDLMDFKDCDCLIVHLVTEVHSSGGNVHQGISSTQGQNVEPAAPPSYEASLRPESRVCEPVQELRLPVLYEDIRKPVKVNVRSVYDTKEIIRQKFAIQGEFVVLGKIKGREKHFDILTDTDMEMVVNAEYLQVKHPQQCQKDSATQKKMAVVYDGTRKLVQVDMSDIERTKDAIALKFSIRDDFILRGKLPGDSNFYDIQNDEDLTDFEDAESFLAERKQSKAQPQARICPPVSPVRHHTFEERVEAEIEEPNYTQPSAAKTKAEPIPAFLTQVPQRKTPTKILPVTFEGRRKSVTCDLASLRNIKDAAREKFQIECDINVKAISETNEHFDIDDENDLDDLRTARSLLIERKVEGVPEGWPQPESVQDSSKQLQLVPANSTALVSHQGVYLEEAGAKLMVMYKKCKYTLEVPPPVESEIVKEQMKNLEGNIDISTILTNMEVTAFCLRLASLGVQQNHGLHKMIQDMQFVVAKLSSLCDSTIVEFRIKAGDVLNDLENGFSYLFEEHFEFAEEHFKSIGVTSKKMLEKTITLEAEVKAKAEYIEGVLNEVTLDYTKEPGQMYDESASSLLQGRIERGKRESSESREKCRQLDGDIEKSKEGIAKAAMSKKPVREDFMKWVGQGWVYKSELDGVVSDKEKMLKNMAKEERLKELREIRSAKEQELRANQDLMKMVEDMKEMVSKNADGMVERSLQGAKQGVKSLLSSLTPLVAFWRTLALACESIANGGIAGRLLKTCEKTNGEEKKKFWEGPAFKQQALKFYAKWVALQKMCTSFHVGMETVQQSIHLSISEHPSPEDAKTRLEDLLDDFDKKIVRQMQEIQKELQKKDKLAKAAAEKKAIEESGSEDVLK